jgi:hypothetical protein
VVKREVVGQKVRVVYKDPQNICWKEHTKSRDVDVVSRLPGKHSIREHSGMSDGCLRDVRSTGGAVKEDPDIEIHIASSTYSYQNASRCKETR